MTQELWANFPKKFLPGLQENRKKVMDNESKRNNGILDRANAAILSRDFEQAAFTEDF